MTAQELLEAYAAGERNFIAINLMGADLSRAFLSGADLSAVDLMGANLSGAYLDGADLSGANLIGANLSFAVLSGTNLSGAEGANFEGAIM